MENEKYIPEVAQKYVNILEKNHAGNPFNEEVEYLDQFKLAYSPFGSYNPVYVKFGYLKTDHPATHCYGRKDATVLQGSFNIYHDGTGIFVARHWSVTPDGKNDMKVSFFRFGCKHEIESTQIGRCLHRDTCKKCGWSHEVDSSD